MPNAEYRPKRKGLSTLQAILIGIIGIAILGCSSSPEFMERLGKQKTKQDSIRQAKAIIDSIRDDSLKKIAEEKVRILLLKEAERVDGVSFPRNGAGIQMIQLTTELQSEFHSLSMDEIADLVIEDYSTKSEMYLVHVYKGKAPKFDKFDNRDRDKNGRIDQVDYQRWARVQPNFFCTIAVMPEKTGGGGHVQWP